MGKAGTHFLFLFLALFAVPAVAGPLATDGSSYLGIWNGTTPFSSGTGLDGTIDWAVYAPGNTPAGFVGVPDPSTTVVFAPTPGEFLYTYQVILDPGSLALSAASVVIENAADNIGDFTATGVTGDASTSSFIIPLDSANWAFSGVTISTDGLAFCSPMTPTDGLATFIDGGSFAVAIPVPTPSSMSIPEPSTLTLALCGLVGFAFELFRRRGQRGGW